jgi:hypothetical protein
MSAILNQSSLTRLSDGLISFIQHLFGSPDMTPGEYRWSPDEQATKIFISGPFTYSRQRVGSMPTVTVTRGPFTYENRTIDNFKGADANTYENPERVEILSGPITVICECGAGDEATAMAQYILLELQANRLKMKSHMSFLHRLLWTGITPEQPVKEEAEITRWQCSITLQCSIYTGWIQRETGLTRFNSILLRNADENWDSIYGSQTQGSDLFVDNSADFGVTATNSPQFLQQELAKKWYYVSFDGAKMYTIESVVNNKTLQLSHVDENGNNVPFNPTETKSDVKYKIYWNTVHLGIGLPKKN